jgi:ribosome-associated protein
MLAGIFTSGGGNEMRKTKAVAIATNYLEGAKAENIEIVDVRGNTPFADYWVMATAPNPRALKAYATDLEEKYAEAKIEVRKKEGEAQSGWIIIDAHSVVCHLFVEDKRKEFDLDGLLAKQKKKG